MMCASYKVKLFEVCTFIMHSFDEKIFCVTIIPHEVSLLKLKLFYTDPQ